MIIFLDPRQASVNDAPAGMYLANEATYAAYARWTPRAEYAKRYSGSQAKQLIAQWPYLENCKQIQPKKGKSE